MWIMRKMNEYIVNLLLWTPFCNFSNKRSLFLKFLLGGLDMKFVENFWNHTENLRSWCGICWKFLDPCRNFPETGIKTCGDGFFLIFVLLILSLLFLEHPAGFTIFSDVCCHYFFDDAFTLSFHSPLILLLCYVSWRWLRFTFQVSELKTGTQKVSR